MQRNTALSRYKDEDDDEEEQEEEEGIEVDDYDLKGDEEKDDLKLLPKQVRALARKLEFCKEIPSVMAASSSVSKDSSHSSQPVANGMWSKLTSVIRLHSPKKIQTPPVILSFIVRDSTAEQEADLLARIHVYCNSGTVGVCRVQNDQVREMFFRNCSLRRVEKLLQYPPPLRNVRQMETLLQAASQQQQQQQNISSSDNDSTLDDSTWVTTWIDEKEEQDLKNDLELLDVAIAILQGEKDDLASHARYLAQCKEEQQEEETRVDEDDDDDEEEDRIPSTSAKDHPPVGGGRSRRRPPKDIPPTDFSYSLSSKTMHIVDTWLQEGCEQKDGLTCVTTNGLCTILVFASGKYSFTPTVDIPPNLRHVLQVKTATKTKINYVSLGTNQRFFVSFEDGECNWLGPKSLDLLLKDSHTCKRIVSVAFGQQNSAYFIVYENGSWDSGGQGIPSGLMMKLKERKNLQDLACVTLGPNGEWFLKAKNGRMWWGGVSAELDDAYNAAIARKKKLRFVCFGEDGSYFMTFIKDK